jgi:hypothetical protein
MSTTSQSSRMTTQVCSHIPTYPSVLQVTNTSSPLGGKKILQRVAGKDASKQFWKYHNEGILKKYQKQLQVGSLDTKPKPAAEPMPVAVPKKEAPKPKAASSAVAAPAEQSEALEPFGQQIPFGDPSWYQSVRTPPPPPFFVFPQS